MADQPTLDEFRTEVLAFLDANAERKPEEKQFTWGEGDDDVAMFEEVEPEVERRQLEEAKAWRAKRYDAGLGYITGPKSTGARAERRPRARLRQPRGPVRGAQAVVLRHRARHGGPDDQGPRPAPRP
jgi:hypothetical protein